MKVEEGEGGRRGRGVMEKVEGWWRKAAVVFLTLDLGLLTLSELPSSGGMRIVGCSHI